MDAKLKVPPLTWRTPKWENLRVMFGSKGGRCLFCFQNVCTHSRHNMVYLLVLDVFFWRASADSDRCDVWLNQNEQINYVHFYLTWIPLHTHAYPHFFVGCFVLSNKKRCFKWYNLRMLHTTIESHQNPHGHLLQGHTRRSWKHGPPVSSPARPWGPDEFTSTGCSGAGMWDPRCCVWKFRHYGRMPDTFSTTKNHQVDNLLKNLGWCFEESHLLVLNFIDGNRFKKQGLYCRAPLALRALNQKPCK